MILFALQAVIVPAAVGIFVLLLPRRAWSVEATQGVSPWTASLAVACAFVGSLCVTDGVSIFELDERWQFLVIAVGIVGAGGILCRDDQRERWFTSMVIVLAPIIAFLALRMPGFDGLGPRLMAGAGTGIASLTMARPSERAGRWTAVIIALASAAMAGMLMSVGSSKVAFAAASVACVALVGAAIAHARGGFRPGAAFAMASLTTLAALASYGAAYHEGEGVHPVAWWFVAFSPCVVVASPAARRVSS